MKFATFNLFQFIAPGYYWYLRNERSTYTAQEWTQKKNWIKARLQQMEADIVGFQEVFSIPELQALCAEAGYDHFITVDQAGCSPDDAQIYIRSVVALASRFPFKALHPVGAPAEISAELPISTVFHFKREPICADIDLPGLGVVTVYVCHLKSQRPVSLDMHYAELTDWRRRASDTLKRLSRGTIASLTQRGIEATLLYHDMAQRLEQDSSHPIILLGDFNDELQAKSLSTLTMQERIYCIGGVPAEQWPEETVAYLHDYRLADTFRLAPNMRHHVRPFTVINHGEGKVLDYILVSNSLNPKNPDARAEIIHYEVWNQHLGSDGVNHRLQSDHGQVCVEVLPCSVSPDYTGALFHAAAHPLKSTAEIVTRQDFVEYAGGVFQSAKHFRQWDSREKWKYFWSFFFDTEYGWVPSIYGVQPVSELYQKKRHSIEHVIPRDFLDRYLARKGVPRHVRYGATVNPFNFAPSERGLNAKRSNFPFDLEDDHIVRPYNLDLHPESFSGTGFDADHEWVIPSRNRGDIARAILYMLLVYEIDELYNRHVDTLVHWAKIDSPSAWEIAYNHWIHTQRGIRNPFIDTPENALRLLDNRELLQALSIE